MPFLLLALFIGVPLVEIALFIEVGGWIGLWPTIAIVILTAVIGTSLLRMQGLETLRRAQSELNAQRLPVRELFDAACLLIAGVLLLTPGFFTDAIGFVLLIPPLRFILGMWVWRTLQRRGTVHVHGAHFGSGGPRSPGPGGPVIDADYEDLSAERADTGGDKPQLEPGPDMDNDAQRRTPGRHTPGGRRRPDSPWRQDGSEPGGKTE